MASKQFPPHWTYFDQAGNPPATASFDVAVVLVVEDEDQVPVLAEYYLEEQGHQALSAGTLAGALALLQQSPAVDLLFTDSTLKATSRVEDGAPIVRRERSAAAAHTAAGAFVADGVPRLFNHLK